MHVREGLALFPLFVAACSTVEPKRPDPDGIVVLDVPSASAAVPTAQRTVGAVEGKPEPVDLESCIAKVRKDPFPVAPVDGRGAGQYQAGIAAEQRGDADVARKAYFDLVQSSDKSPFVPLAYFAFGELFRAELGSDPSKVQFAMQAYNETLKYPAPENPLWEVALVRKAELSAMSGDGELVMSSLHAMVRANSKPRCVEGLSRAVETMLPPAYAATGRPEKAAAFFATFGIDEVTARMTARLARLYITQQKKPDAVAALRGLANSKVPGAALCGEALAAAQELGDPGLVRDLGAKCNR